MIHIFIQTYIQIIVDDIMFKRDVLSIKLNKKIILKNHLLSYNKSFFDYIIDYTIGLPNKIKLFISKIIISNNDFNKNSETLNEKYFVDEIEEKLFLRLNNVIKININKETRFVELNVKLNNPIFSSIVANEAVKILQSYLINYKVSSAKNILDFTKKNYDIKKHEFEKIQNELAKFKDENQIISSSLFSNKLFILQNKFDLEKTLFQELSKQYEQAKIKVTKEYTYICNFKKC